VKMPTTAPRPMLKLAQFATMLRLKLAPSSVLLPRDQDFDVSLALPALKDVVRLFTRGEKLPFGAMAFSNSTMFPPL